MQRLLWLSAVLVFLMLVTGHTSTAFFISVVFHIHVVYLIQVRNNTIVNRTLKATIVLSSPFFTVLY